MLDLAKKHLKLLHEGVGLAGAGVRFFDLLILDAEFLVQTVLVTLQLGNLLLEGGDKPGLAGFETFRGRGNFRRGGSTVSLGAGCPVSWPVRLLCPRGVDEPSRVLPVFLSSSMRSLVTSGPSMILPASVRSLRCSRTSLSWCSMARLQYRWSVRSARWQRSAACFRVMNPWMGESSIRLTGGQK